MLFHDNESLLSHSYIDVFGSFCAQHGDWRNRFGWNQEGKYGMSVEISGAEAKQFVLLR